MLKVFLFHPADSDEYSISAYPRLLLQPSIIKYYITKRFYACIQHTVVNVKIGCMMGRCFCRILSCRHAAQKEKECRRLVAEK